MYFDFGCRGPALAVAGLDGSIAAPARDESAWFAAAPRAEVAAVRGVWAEREPAHRRCMSTEATASPERVMAKPRAVSSSSARAGTRTATVLRSLSLPPGTGASSPRAHFAGASAAPFGQAVAGVEQRGDDRVRKAAPDGP